MSEQHDLRVNARATDLLDAVKLAVAAADLTSKDRGFELVRWIVAEHEPHEHGHLAVAVFLDAIKAVMRRVP